MKRPVGFWIAGMAIVIATIWVLHAILLPFVSGMVIAYLLDPLVNRLERLGLGRIVATTAILGVFGVTIVMMFLLIGPVLIGQLAAFIAALPELVVRVHTAIADSHRPWLTRLVGVSLGDSDMADLLKQLTGGFLVFLRSLLAGGEALISMFWLLVITPVVAFYMICDWPRMVATVDGWLPRDHAGTIRMLVREIDTAIAGFIRGQSGICLIVASLYAVGLSLVGLQYAVLIGAVTGFLSFIPYVGSLTGFMLAVGIAFAQFWPDGLPIVSVFGVCIVCQFLEDYILAPALVGSIIGLHPVWLMFSLFAFGSVFGFVGLLLAVPMAAATGVLLRFAVRQYLASSLYSGRRTT